MSSVGDVRGVTGASLGFRLAPAGCGTRLGAHGRVWRRRVGVRWLRETLGQLLDAREAGVRGTPAGTRRSISTTGRGRSVGTGDPGGRWKTTFKAFADF